MTDSMWTPGRVRSYEEAYLGQKGMQEELQKRLMYENITTTAIEAAKKLGGSAAAIADMVLGVIPGVLSAAEGMGVTARAINLYRDDPRLAYRAGLMAMREGAGASVSAPLHKLLEFFNSGEAYTTSPVATAISKLDELIKDAGTWTERNLGVPAEGVEQLAHTILALAGARGLDAAVQLRKAREQARAAEKLERQKSEEAVRAQQAREASIAEELAHRKRVEENLLRQQQAAQKAYNDLFGIRTASEQAAIRKQRKRDLEEAFRRDAPPVILDDGRIAGQGPGYADYLAHLANERIANSRAWLAENAHKELTEQFAAQARRIEAENLLQAQEMAQARYRAYFGIKTPDELKELHAKRARDLNEAFNKAAPPMVLPDGRIARQGPAAADTLAAQAEAAARTTTERAAREAHEQAMRQQELTQALAVELSRTPEAAAARAAIRKQAYDEQTYGDRKPTLDRIIEILQKPPEARTAEDLLNVRAWNRQRGRVDTDFLLFLGAFGGGFTLGYLFKDDIYNYLEPRVRRALQYLRKPAPPPEAPPPEHFDVEPQPTEQGTFEASLGAAGLGIMGGRIGAKRLGGKTLERFEAGERALAAGMGPSSVWRFYGYERGAERKGRFEISDVNSKLNLPHPPTYTSPTVYTGFVGELFNHPELFKAYPEIRYTRLKLTIDPRIRSGDPQGRTSFDDGLIEIKANNLRDAHSVLLHELNHVVQDFEGHALGTSVAAAGWTRYFNNAGEVESRNVSRRFLYPHLMRYRPSLTEDVPRWRQEVNVWGPVLADSIARARQRGAVSADLLRAVSAIGLGGLIGSQLADEHPYRGALLGALAGAYIGLPNAKRRLERTAETADYFIGALSTQIRNISPAVRMAMVRFEKNNLMNSFSNLQYGVPFFSRLQRLPKDARDDIAAAIYTGAATAEDILRAHGGQQLVATWHQLRSALDRLGSEAKSYGLLGNLVENYFPRLVADKEGLFNAIGREASSYIKKALEEANEISLRQQGRELTAWEEARVINRELQSFHRSPAGRQLPFFKGRTIKEVTKELLPYYATPAESYYGYVRHVVHELETAKFFGKDLVTRPAAHGPGSVIDLDVSIGNVVGRELRAGRITEEQVPKLVQLLEYRFKGGERSPSTYVQQIRAITHMGLLGDHLSAVVQLGDLPLAIRQLGLRPAIAALALKVSGRERLHARDFYLADHIMEELVHASKPGQKWYDPILWANKVLKYTIGTIDRPIKDISLNAALAKYERMVQTPAGVEKLRRMYGDMFLDQFDALVADLRAKRITDNTTTLAFAELSEFQPVSKLEVPPGYLQHPDARLFYVIKSFQLKQFDILRRDALQEIAKGTPEGIAKGIRNLFTLGIALGIGGATSAAIKDWLLGRPVEFSMYEVVDNALKTFGLGEYVRDKLASGRALDVGAAIGSIVLPPWQMFAEVVSAEPSAVRYIPFVGEFFYEHYLGGAEKYEVRKALREKQKTGIMPPLSPEAQDYLRREREERRLRRLERELQGVR